MLAERTVEEERREQEYIVGVFGIWPYPILNILLQFIERLRALRSAAQPPQAYLPKVATRRTEYVRDKEGRIIERYEEISLE